MSKKKIVKTEYEQLPLFDLMDDMKYRDQTEDKEKAESEVNEHVKKVTGMELPLDWDNIYEDDARTAGQQTESIPDGLVKSLNILGRVDIEYISAITGEEYKTVIRRLAGSIYQNPRTWNECFYKGFETAEEYLSGNIAEKLREATEANEHYNGYFQANVDALEKILPRGISIRDIYVTLGSPWVPAGIIESFIEYIQGNERYYYNTLKVRHDELTGTWDLVSQYSWESYKKAASYACEQQFGTSRLHAMEILLRTLNMQSVAVYDTVSSDLTKSGKQRVLNKKETVIALDRQRDLIKAFQSWVWTDLERARELKGIYEERFLSVRKRSFDGSFLEFPGMDQSVGLYPYQKNAVARILFSNNTLLAHDVGSGKTYVMAAAGMEMRRLKMSEKNLYVVPNNITGQWKNIFHMMYPDASLLVIEPKDFTSDKREGVLERMLKEEFDGIIIAYSCFGQIPISNKSRIETLKETLRECKAAQTNQVKKTGRLARRIEKLKDLIADLSVEEEPDGICFDELGVTRLFVDEAHNFKNVPIATKTENVLGISSAGSKKCEDMMQKVRIVQRHNGGKGVIFATGTPITNSITDAFILQSYLQSGTLKLMELESFDSWIGMFAEKSSNFEIDVDTSTYRMATRFSRFHNIPELTMMLAQIADFHQADDSFGIPSHDGYQDELVKKTRGFSDYLKHISERAENVRKGRVSRSEDNMLKITTDGRKAALDLRLADKNAGFTAVSKVFSCAENVERIYRTTSPQKSTQLVFCDTSTPKQGFNIYDELKELLVKMGLPGEEIAYIHDAKTDAQREKLFKAINSGRIRVLIGSTPRLGLGVNVQEKLIALHHLDVPWRPADMVQREGRILRQGNENKTVFLYRYITEGSFDAYSWQLLETKQRFISDLLSGSVEERSGSDIDNTVLNYAEVKALAIGNPMIKKRVETANELSRVVILQQKYIASREQYEKELRDLPDTIAKLEALISKCEADAALFEQEKAEYTPEERRELRHRIFEASHLAEPAVDESLIMEYQGFRVIVPPGSYEMHPIIWLKGSGRYSVEMTSSEIGSMQRIDRCLEDLGNREKRLRDELSKVLNKQEYIREELNKDDSYADRIAFLKKNLLSIDKELGIAE
ncbi:MAG: DEAD/DEAH box helicase family protein [Lachnospiraceae bacterium]|nr:DEAD/DEAH box helicase family protein [Lachnospiraceae bacterium]